MPKRIQLRRTAGWRKPEGVIVVSRPTVYGNPYRVGEFLQSQSRGWLEPLVITPALAVALFIVYLEQQPGWRDQQARELAGRDLACWCRIGEPCHADVLLELANP